MPIWNAWVRLADGSRAIENAREASRELSRLRVEREDVQLYLEQARTAAAPARRAATS